MADEFVLNFSDDDGEKNYLMTRYKTNNIFVASPPSQAPADWDQPKRSKLSALPADWFAGMSATLTMLFEYSPKATGLAVLARINATTKKLLIFPDKDGNTSNAIAGPVDRVAATPKDEPQYSKCRATPPDENDSSTWQECEIDPAKPKGNGQGSDAAIRFTAKNFSEDRGPCSKPDEGLLHEVVHALRFMLGVANSAHMRVVKNGNMMMIFGSIEEFIAILVTNIYHSEVRRKGLRADHTRWKGVYRSLGGDLVDPAKFYKTYKPEVDKLRAQSDGMKELYKELANITCDFNPIWHAVFRPNG